MNGAPRSRGTSPEDQDVNQGGSAEGFRPGRRWTHGVGVRILAWVVLLFVTVLILFVALDLRHEWRVAERLGASESQLAAIRAQTLWLHVAHGVVTVILFTAGICLVVQRLVTRRVEAIVEAVRHFRLGTWRARIPHANLDEIEWLAEAVRQLGPFLAQKVQTFLEVDRKATIARMGLLYDDRLTAPTRRVLMLARSMMKQERDRWAWLEVEQDAMKILAGLGQLARPEHPSLREISRVGPSLSPGGPMGDPRSSARFTGGPRHPGGRGTAASSRVEKGGRA